MVKLKGVSWDVIINMIYNKISFYLMLVDLCRSDF